MFLNKLFWSLCQISSDSFQTQSETSAILFEQLTLMELILFKKKFRLLNKIVCFKLILKIIHCVIVRMNFILCFLDSPDPKTCKSANLHNYQNSPYVVWWGTKKYAWEAEFNSSKHIYFNQIVFSRTVLLLLRFFFYPSFTLTKFLFFFKITLSFTLSD